MLCRQGCCRVRRVSQMSTARPDCTYKMFDYRIYFAVRCNATQTRSLGLALANSKITKTLSCMPRQNT